MTVLVHLCWFVLQSQFAFVSFQNSFGVQLSDANFVWSLVRFG